MRWGCGPSRGSPRPPWGLLGALLVALAACADGRAGREPSVRGGDPGEGWRLVQAYGCTGCHVIPGVASVTSSTIGPPLTRWAERRYIAGSLVNTPADLVLWLMDPNGVEPGTAMPDLGVDEREARHMAAYLFTLGDGPAPAPTDTFPAAWRGTP